MSILLRHGQLQLIISSTERMQLKTASLRCIQEKYVRIMGVGRGTADNSLRHSNDSMH